MKIHRFLLAVLPLASLPTICFSEILSLASNRYHLTYPNRSPWSPGAPLVAVIYYDWGYRMPIDIPASTSRFDAIKVVAPDGTTTTIASNTRATEGFFEGKYEFAGPGTYVAITRSRPSFVFLVRDNVQGNFSDVYAGKDEVPPGVTPIPGEAYFFRDTAKTIIYVDGTGATDGKSCEPVGYDLEFVPTKNPARIAVGESLTVQLLFKGKPYIEEPVKVYVENVMSQYLGGAGRWIGKTDKQQGRVTIPVTLPGIWRLKAVLRKPATGELAVKADIDEYRTTLSFETPGTHSGYPEYDEEYLSNQSPAVRKVLRERLNASEPPR